MACRRDFCFDFDKHACKLARNNNILKTVISNRRLGEGALVELLIVIIKMPDSCCAVQCTNMQGKCDKKIKFYRFPTTKTEQITEKRKMWITAMKREN